MRPRREKRGIDISQPRRLDTCSVRTMVRFASSAATAATVIKVGAGALVTGIDAALKR